MLPSSFLIVGLRNLGNCEQLRGNDRTVIQRNPLATTMLVVVAWLGGLGESGDWGRSLESELWDWFITAECIPEKYVRRAKNVSFLPPMDTKRHSDSFEKKSTMWQTEASAPSASCHGGVELAGALGSNSVRDSQLGSAIHQPNAIVPVTVGVLSFFIVEQGKCRSRGSHVISNWHSTCKTSKRCAGTW